MKIIKRNGSEVVFDITKIIADCDRDALTVYVRKDGPACHLGNNSLMSGPGYFVQALNWNKLERYLLLLQQCYQIMELCTVQSLLQ